jgi:cytochrome P450
MVSIMTHQTQLSLERLWKGSGQSAGGSVITGVRVELHQWFAELTLSIMLASSFGTSVTDDPRLLRQIVGGLHEYLQVTRQRVTSGIAFIPIACNLPIAGKPDLDRISATLNATVEQIIRDRRAGRSHATCEGDDLLDILLNAVDTDTGKGFSDEVIRSQSLTFVLAGTDTTSSLLTWLARDLSQRPELWQRCREEVQRVTGGEEIDTSHLPQLSLLDGCIHECLRTRPPAPFFTLLAKDDHWLEPGNDKRPIFVPAGTLVRAETYLIQRDKTLWGEDADQWKEERWLTKEGRPRHVAAFTAFSLGVRGCAGPQFALMEAKSIVANLVRSVELEMDAGQKDAVTQKLVLEPLNGLYATLKKIS